MAERILRWIGFEDIESPVTRYAQIREGVSHHRVFVVEMNGSKLQANVRIGKLCSDPQIRSKAPFVLPEVMSRGHVERGARWR